MKLFCIITKNGASELKRKKNMLKKTRNTKQHMRNRGTQRKVKTTENIQQNTKYFFSILVMLKNPIKRKPRLDPSQPRTVTDLTKMSNILKEQYKIMKEY